MGMDALIHRIKQGLVQNLYPTEKAVSTSIVVPVLRALGWDDTNPKEVVGEYTNPRGRVDYALFTTAGAANVFVEVKAVGRSQDADRQLFEYDFHEGTPLAVLTDGRLWNFYLPGQHGSYEERRVYQIDMVERDTDEIVLRLSRYLKRDRVASGLALDDAVADYRASTRSRVALATLPRAWAELLSDPPEELVEALAAHTEALCGHRPNGSSVLAFLAGQLPTAESLPVLRRPTRLRETPESNIAPQNQPAVPEPIPARAQSTGVSWKVLSRTGVARNGVDAFVAILTILFEAFPTRQSAMADAVRTRGRNNIARQVADSYPGQADLAQRQHRPLPDGWFVGTNESSATKVRILKQATIAVGLRFGEDVDINL